MPISDLKELPLFPTPYPGECFYSVLCRYHIRSGNATDAFSIKQLFGYNTSLASTVLSPYHLDVAKYWFPPSVGISAEMLLEQHTGVEPAPILLRRCEENVIRLHILMFGGGPAIRAKTYRVS